MSEATQTPASAKQQGVTSSERFTASLCERSFLRLWCYPNVYRDQGNKKGHGKELCDVLAVFGEHVIIFSDKNCRFPDGPTALAWQRWYRRAIVDSQKQLSGAERWIRSHPTRLFLDRGCSQPFPIPLPDPQRMKFHRIVVASGSATACREFFQGDSGSLMLCPDAPSPLDTHVDPDHQRPFVIARLPPPTVHVLDEVTFPIVLNELDTVADFVAYLSAKEALLDRGDLIVSAGEEHLLAFYLRVLAQTGQTELPPSPDGRGYHVHESLWPGLTSDPEFQRMKRDLRPSYAWDEMMQMLSDDILDQRMVMSNENVAFHEQRVRALASAPRQVRLDLSKALRALLHDDTFATRFRAVCTEAQPDTAYLFLVVKRGGADHDEYRRTRNSLLHGYCLCFARHNRDVRHVVGISTGPASENEDRCHEVAYLDRSCWTDEDEGIAIEFETKCGIFSNVRRTST